MQPLVYISWAPEYNVCILFLYFPPVASSSVVRLHGAEIAMFSVIFNVSIFLCLVLFIRKAGRYTSSSLLNERFRWREKRLRDGLSSHIFPKWLEDLCCLHNFFVLFCRIITEIYGNSSRSVLCFGRQQYHLCVAVQPQWNV